MTATMTAPTPWRGLDHLWLDLPDDVALLALQRRLREAGSFTTMPTTRLVEGQEGTL